MTRKLKHNLILGVFFLLSASLTHAQDSKDLIKINIGGPSAGYYLTYVAYDLGLFQKHGLDANLHWFTSGAPLLSGLKSGSIDHIVTGLATVFAIGNNIPIKIISWELDNSSHAGLMVTEESDITSYTEVDKAGKIGAMPGTCSQISLKIMTKKAGIDFDKLNIVNIPPPLFANSFTGNAIDAAVGWAPWTMVQPDNVKLVSLDSEYGGVCPGVNALRPDYMEANPSVPGRLLAVQAEAREIVENDPQIAIDALERYLQVTPEVAKFFYETHCCEKLPSFEEQLDPESPWSIVARESGLAGQLKKASQALYEIGTVDAPLTYDQLAESIEPGPLKEFVEKRKSQ